jgi:hypothetical protein
LGYCEQPFACVDSSSHEVRRAFVAEHGSALEGVLSRLCTSQEGH